MKTAIVTVIGILILLASAGICAADHSENMYEKGAEVYDSWGVCRTRATREDGFFQVEVRNGQAESFRPVIARESLGDYSDVAVSWGENLASEYGDRQRLAEEIFRKVRDMVEYTSDEALFGKEDFARNADELALDILKDGKAGGDCEDYAVLLSVMYKAAGFRSAVVLAPGHAACLVHLPGYEGANTTWEFEGESGWIWAEATGKNNPLGWTPSEYIGERLLAHEVENVGLEPGDLPEGADSEEMQTGSGGVQTGIPFFNVVFFLWLIPVIARAL